MKPEFADALAAADEALSDARSILSINIWKQAARMAYHAQFHAAQAFIFERSDTVAKTHKGVHREFHRLAKAESTFPLGFARDLSDAYRHKDAADYDTASAKPGSEPGAQEAIAIAERFVAAVRQALGALAPPP